MSIPNNIFKYTYPSNNEQFVKILTVELDLLTSIPLFLVVIKDPLSLKIPLTNALATWELSGNKEEEDIKPATVSDKIRDLKISTYFQGRDILKHTMPFIDRMIEDTVLYNLSTDDKDLKIPAVVTQPKKEREMYVIKVHSLFK